MTVYCPNNGQTYTSDSADPSLTAVETLTENSNAQVTGSVTRINHRVGTINLTYDSLSDEAPDSGKEVKPTYILQFRGRNYIVGNVSTPITNGESVTIAAEVKEAQNPIIPELLSLLGQKKSWTFAVGALPETFDVSAINTRTGATVVFSVEDWDNPGDAPATGISINSSSGLITAAAPLGVGVYDVLVKAADTVTELGEAATTQNGLGRVVITVTA